MYYFNKEIEQIMNSKELLIFGARIVATEVANCLKRKPYNLSICSFVVTERKGNPEQLLGIPVITIEEAKEKFLNATVLVAVMEKYYLDIEGSLRTNGFRNIIPLTFECELWSEIRGNFYQELRISCGKNYLTFEEEIEKTKLEGMEAAEVNIYRAVSQFDKKVMCSKEEFDWEIPIQVGRSLTEQRITLIGDDTGENISHKNKEYCELTALYWIWKNDKSAYAGLCHYRRHFALCTEELERLAYSDIDVVLTIPILNFPNVKATYAHDHVESDWNVMMDAIEKLAPAYLDTARRLQEGVFYYGYNMFIARKEILNHYCQWLFPILFYCEKKCEKKEDTYQNRYIGFLAERLLSIYFLHNENQYKIVHIRKKFLHDI